MLKKFNEASEQTSPFVVGASVFVVTRLGEILEGFTVKSRLMQLFTLDRSPLDGTDKQGFTLRGDVLRPNWCEGKRRLYGVYAAREQAQQVADIVKQRKVRTAHSRAQEI